MAKLDTAGIRMAKRTLARWFRGSEPRRFVPLKGPALEVSRDEELAITAAAEAFIAGRYDRAQGQLALCFLLTVAAPMLYWWLAGGTALADWISVGTVSAAAFSFGGLAMLAAGWSYERSLFDLRDSIAMSLRERTGGIAAALAVPEGREPDLRKLGVAAFLLTGVFMIWPLASTLWKAASGPLSAASGLALGIALGILLFVTVWAVWLRPAASEDRPL